MLLLFFNWKIFLFLMVFGWNCSITFARTLLFNSFWWGHFLSIYNAKFWNILSIQPSLIPLFSKTLEKDIFASMICIALSHTNLKLWTLYWLIPKYRLTGANKVTKESLDIYHWKMQPFKLAPLLSSTILFQFQPKLAQMLMVITWLKVSLKMSLRLDVLLTSAFLTKTWHFYYENLPHFMLNKVEK